ncbi:MAG: FHA domain-containing protein [Methanospirillaceae archaeon]|nr:FHA domain-containing protein [Methanospirillaceae archaeon]
MTQGENVHTLIIDKDPEFLEELSDYLDVLGSATRLRILKAIEHHPKDVRAISRDIETSYENTKKHLNKLLLAGVIRKEPGMSDASSKGLHPVWKYSIQPGGLEAIVRNLGVFSNIPIPVSDEELSGKLAEIRTNLSHEISGAVPVLMMIGGHDDGKVYPLKATSILLGREDKHMRDGINPDRDVVLPASYGSVTRISHPHARLKKTDDIWHIEDSGSTGGTYVNDRQLNHKEMVPLSDGDIIVLGKGPQSARFIINIPEKERETGK